MKRPNIIRERKRLLLMMMSNIQDNVLGYIYEKRESVVTPL